MTEHDHSFDLPAPPGTVLFCSSYDPTTLEDCGAMAVVDHRTLQPRPLTGEELLTVTAHMMEAIAIGQAMQIIHGRDRGLARARQALGYTS